MRIAILQTEEALFQVAVESISGLGKTTFYDLVLQPVLEAHLLQLGSACRAALEVCLERSS